MTVKRFKGAGFAGMTNGELLASAEPLFDVLITIDRNLRYQQQLADRDLAILVLCGASNDISDLSPLLPAALAALTNIKPGQVIEISQP